MANENNNNTQNSNMQLSRKLKNIKENVDNKGNVAVTAKKPVGTNIKRPNNNADGFTNGLSNGIGDNKTRRVSNGMSGEAMNTRRSLFGTRLNRNRGIIGSNTVGASSNETGGKSRSDSNNIGGSSVDDQYNGVQSDVEDTVGVGESTEAELNVVKKILKIFTFLVVKIAFIIVGFLIFLLLFIVVMISPLIALGIVDLGDLTKAFSYDGDSGSYNGGSNYYTSVNYVETSNNSDFWWPIGSRETTTINGVLFASGTPGSTTITDVFNSSSNIRSSRHTGIDISAGINVENIIATKDGVVEYPYSNSNISIDTCDYYGTKANCSGYGNYVKIKHNDGSVSLYGHMYADSITVRNGDIVKQGQVIGKSGSSGNSTGGHLHFEIIIGTYVDPQEYVSANNPRPVSTDTDSPQTIPLSFSVVRGD